MLDILSIVWLLWRDGANVIGCDSIISICLPDSKLCCGIFFDNDELEFLCEDASAFLI